MIQINQQIKPTHPDGWHYWDGDIRLQADSYSALIVKVTEYRISQRRPWDTVQADVNEYLVSVSPTNRGPDKGPYQKPPKTLADKVYNWLSRTYDKVSSSISYAGAPEASRRAAICSRCPYNVVADSQCGVCVTQMGRMSRGIAKGRRASGDGSLKNCALHFYDLKVAVHLENDILGEPEPMDTMPPTCWRLPK